MKSIQDFGATSIDKIGEVQLLAEIGEGGFKITFKCEIPTFLLLRTFFEEGGGV